MLNCHNCGKELSPAANFCSYCGVAQGNAAAGAAAPDEESLAPEPADGGDPSGQLAALRAIVRELQAEVARSARRIAALENALFLPGPATPADRSTATVPPDAAAAPTAGPPPVAAVPPAVPAPPGYYAAAPAGLAGAPAGEPPRSLPDRVAGMDWEWLLGGNWLARIGILALIIGMGFFLKLAFDNDWIGEIGRVLLGLVVGLALLGGGEYWRKKYPIWAQALTGGGIAILYLSVFAAFAFYGLMPALAALGLFSLVTLAAAGLALRYEARAIAILGILGGFLSPLLLAEGLAEQWVLLAYVVVLDLGVLGLAAFRNWRWFTLLGLVGSLALYGFWRAALEPGLLLSQIGITVIFLIFVGATTLFHLIWRRAPGPLDLALMSLNAAAYFGISYALLFSEFRDWMGGFTLLLALFYGALGYGIMLRHRGLAPLSLFALAIALVLLTIAAPVQFNGPWLTVAWAAEAVALVGLSFTLKMYQLRWFGVGVLALIAIRLLILDSFPLDSLETYAFLLNRRFLAYAVGIGAMYLVAYALWRWRERYFHPEERWLIPPVLVAANFLSLFVLSLEIFEAITLNVLPVPPNLAGNVSSLSLSLLWAVYAAVLIVVGIVRRSRWTRLAGLGLLAIPIIKLFLYDAFAMEREYRVAAFISLGVLLVIGGFLYQRYRRVIRGFLLDD